MAEDYKLKAELGRRIKTDYVSKTHIEDENDVNPTVDDDASLNYSYGSLWINKIGGGAYICLDPNPGNAVWWPIT